MLTTAKTALVGALAVVLVAAVQEVRVQSAQKSALSLKAEVAQVNGAREKAARIYEAALGEKERRHFAQQQEKDDAYNDKLRRLEASLAAGAAESRRLRDKLAAATARPASFDPTDAPACQRNADRLEALGKLAGEGAELLGEGRSLLQRRDAEVVRLREQIDIDRAACH